MKFDYKKLSPGREAPIITIKVRNPKTGKSVPVSVLVDSGADANYFHITVGRIIGLDVELGVQETVQGIGGAAHSYQHDVELDVGGWIVPTRAGFMKDFGGYAQGVVGQRGFFDAFSFVKFQKQKGKIEIGDLLV